MFSRTRRHLLAPIFLLLVACSVAPGQAESGIPATPDGLRQFIEEQGHDGWVVQVEGNSPMLLFLDEDYHLYSCPAGQAVDAAAKASCKKNAAGFIGALLDVSDAGALYCARTSHTVSNPDGHVGSICVSQADFKWSFPDPANPEATLTHQIRVGVPVYILMERATETTLMAADLRSVKLRPSP